MPESPFFRLADGRLRGELSPLLEGVYPASDHRSAFQLAGVHRFDKAHMVGLTESGLIPQEAGRAVLGALRAMDERGRVVAERLEIGGYLHSGEKYLRESVGEDAAGWIHLGRSSGDLTTVSLRLTQRDRVLALVSEALSCTEVLLDLASAHRATIMPAYTHLQHAQPTSLGHDLAAWATEGLRRTEALLDFLRRTDESPAGAAVGTGSPFDIPVRRVADLLGFERVFLNSRDANFGMDSLTECLACVAMLANEWSRLSNQLQIWSSPEFGFAEIADGFATTSSILPQKKNPIALQHVRGLAALATGALMAALQTTSQIADTVIIDREAAHDEMWETLDRCIHGARLLGGILDSLSFDAARMLEAAAGSWGFAYDLAVGLVDRGLNWRRAHQTSARVVADLVSASRAPGSLTVHDVEIALAELSLSVPVDDALISTALDAGAGVAAKRVPGGPAADDVECQVGDLRGRLGAQRAAVDARRRRQAHADRTLEQAIDAILTESPHDTPPAGLREEEHA